MFDTTLDRMLGRVSDTRDKRQGSIIYDALAPVAAELTQTEIVAEIFKEQTNLLTATGENLDNRAKDNGITRNPATHATRIAEMTDTDGNPIDLSIGSRFSTPNTAGGLNFSLTENLPISGQCLLICETAGTAGNTYLGALLPLFAINNLGSATMTGTYTPAEDTETDEELRSRISARINRKSYGGNVADYKEFTGAIPGVGDVKVFPVWDGGGTVMLSIIDSEYNIATSDFISVVQNEIDPIGHNGEGMGIAPIGHRVTVITPTELIINITAALNLQAGYTASQLQPSIKAAIEGYLLELRKSWADADSISVFAARIVQAIMGLHGISNVTNVTINGSTADLTIPQSSSLQQLPMLGNVVLSNA